jgi:hypothetical protein
VPIFYFISVFLGRFIFIKLFKNQLEANLQADFVYSLLLQLFAVRNMIKKPENQNLVVSGTSKKVIMIY